MPERRTKGDGGITRCHTAHTNAREPEKTMTQSAENDAAAPRLLWQRTDCRDCAARESWCGCSGEICRDCGAAWKPVRRGECSRCGSDNTPIPPRSERAGGGPMNLADFLLARIAEDEAMARADLALRFVPSLEPRIMGTGGEPTDRARVLAECEAKRRIVEWDEVQLEEHPVLRFLALPYADHPDYREEWKP